MNWIQILGPSILIVLGGLITWLIKSKSEELRTVEENLRETRRDVYSEILAPYIKLFADSSPNSQAQVTQQITSHPCQVRRFRRS